MKSAQQKGFSLTEVLVALAITSLASLALFQSMGMWVEISGKATNAAERAVSETVHEAQLRTVVSGLISGWSDRQEEIFIGKPDFFSGLTTKQLHVESPALEVVTIELKQEARDLSINYLSHDTAWTMRTFPDAKAQFTYLGANGQWYDAWPPATTPEPGPFRDSDFYDTPQLPMAIKLAVQSGELSEITIANIESDHALPAREQDVLQDLLGAE